MNTTRVLKTPEEAAAILEYFNGFHDGFIKQLTLNSYGYFERWGCRPARGVWTSSWRSRTTTTATGNLRRTRSSTRFTHVRDLQADMPGRAAEWTIMYVHIEPGVRPSDLAEEPCFYARLLQNRLDEGQWVHHQAPGFSSGKPSSTSHARNRQAAAAR
jgi:hypothetical protein